MLAGARTRTFVLGLVVLLSMGVPCCTEEGEPDSDSGAGLPLDAHPGGPDASSDLPGIDGEAANAGIWRPKPQTTWHWQLSGTVDSSIDVAMYDIDLFDSDSALISQLKTAGRVVICYFSAGSYAAWRSDAQSFPQAAKGDKMDGWDELWIDIRSDAVRQLMVARLDLAASKGCDGVEPDNVDGYANPTGFPLTAAEQKAYLKFLADEAHARGLSIGLKNALGLAADVVGDFDWALNEECIEFDECGSLEVFIAADKAVFNAEYSGTKQSVCAKATALKFSTLIKKKELGVWYEACW